MRLSIIAAIGARGEIGKDGGLPWRLPADLRYFRATTTGHHVIMGRKTWEEVGKPLPDRVNIVISRRAGFPAEGATVVTSLEEAIELCRADDEAFVIGGSEIYREALPRADRLYLTRIHAEFDADTYFPAFDESNWTMTSREDHDPDEKNRWSYSFTIWERR